MTVENVTFERFDGENFVTLPSGSYVAKLTDVSAQMKSSQFYEGEQLRIQFDFEAQAPTGEITKVFRDVKPSLNSKANLTKDLMGMTGQRVDTLDDSQVAALMNSLIGQTFLVTVEQYVNAQGVQKHKFRSVARLPQQMQQPAPQPVQAPQQPVAPSQPEPVGHVVQKAFAAVTPASKLLENDELPF